MKLQNLIHILIGIVCIGLLPKAQAISPAPDGGYPGGNTAEGQNALFSLTTGGYNTALGFFSLRSDSTGSFNTAVGAGTLLANTADENTATGAGALLSNTTGVRNTANGADTLLSNTTGFQNTANGSFALYSNTTGSFNTALGANALFSNTTGGTNTANGYQALLSNSTGDFNTANGAEALYSNTDGVNNTASGYHALLNNTEGSGNTADGVEALNSNTTGGTNTANGYRALLSNTTGDNNTANGNYALYNNTNGYGNTASGYGALSSCELGSYNVALGQEAGQNIINGNNNIEIANDGTASDNNTIRIGRQYNTFAHTSIYLAGIWAQPVGVGETTCYVDYEGKLGTKTSSRRFKKDITDMDAASEALLSLRPVTFRYKPELDAKGIPQFGLVAEEVEKVNPDLVVRDKEGKPYSVRYEAVNAMLLNEFLKEHRKVEEQDRRWQEQEAMIVQQQKGMETLVAQFNEQAAQIQKVSDKLAAASPSRGGLNVSGPAPQIVLNNQ